MRLLLKVLVTYSVKNGIILLVIAFLVSPVGLPMAVAWLIGNAEMRSVLIYFKRKIRYTLGK